MADWPELSAQRDHPTLAILHLVSQMIGKIRVASAPWANHGWHVALHPVPGGLTSALTQSSDGRTFVLKLDLLDHQLELTASDGSCGSVPLALGSIANIHAALTDLLESHGLLVEFDGLPSEIERPIRFADDHSRRIYDPDSAVRLLQAFNLVVPIFERFRAGFSGKASPVHLFWGAFDLAVTRFSGRRAPTHPGGIPGLPDRITREAYSHEVSSAGFWPGGVTVAEPMFYSYAYPEPAGFRDASVRHGQFDAKLGEWVLPYAKLREADDADAMLTAFLQSTYAAAADLAQWDRAELERSPLPPV